MRRLGDAAEIVVDRRPPAGLDHVEIDRTRQAIGLIKPTLQAVGGHAVAAIAIDLLEQRVHAEGDAMGEQRSRLASSSAASQSHSAVVRRHVGLPGLVPLVDGLRGRTLLQIRRLDRQDGPGGRRLQASRRIASVESVDTELVQKRSHRDLRIARNRVPQRERAMRGQLHDEPVGQRPDGSSSSSSSAPG